MGLAGPLMGILLWTIFIFYNPYSSGQIDADTFYITFFMLCLPAIAGFLTVVLNRPGYMWVVFIWSLPCGLYFSATPGIFKLYGIVLMLYLAAAIHSLFAKRIGNGME